MYDSPAGSDSEESMDALLDNATPPETPTKEGSPTAGATVDHIGRLSLDHDRQQESRPRSRQGRGMMGASSIRPNRSAHSQSPRSCEHAKARHAQRNPRTAVSKSPKKVVYDRYQHHGAASGENLQRRMIESQSNVRPFVQSHDRFKQPNRVDSGYVSMPSRGNTLVDGKGILNTRVPSTIDEKRVAQPLRYGNAFVPLPAGSRYPGLILQPDSSPISQEQLAAEVKGIYAGLVMVEAKCINIAAGQASDPKSQLGPEQWQSLIALHRTLLYEHHDFLMVS